MGYIPPIRGKKFSGGIVARLSKLSVTNVFFFQSLGKLMLETFSNMNHLWKMFLNFCASSNSSLKVSLGHQWVFLNCYLADSRLTLSHYWGDSLTLLMVITAFLQFWLECQGTLEWGWVPKSGDYLSCTMVFLYYEFTVCVYVSFHHVWFKILHFSFLGQA